MTTNCGQWKHVFVDVEECAKKGGQRDSSGCYPVATGSRYAEKHNMALLTLLDWTGRRDLRVCENNDPRHRIAYS